MLLKTTEVNGHYHAVYFNESLSFGDMSDEGHVHEIIIEQDEQGQDYTLLTEVDGHTHELEQLEYKQVRTKKMSSNDAVEFAREAFISAKDTEEESLTDAEESENFYRGIQWSKGDTQANSIAGKTQLTINEIKPRCDALSGIQRQNRTDIQVLPVESGDAGVADMINIVLRNILEQSNYKYEETRAFGESSSIGRGNLYCDIDSSKNIEGDIIVKHLPWGMVMYGEHTNLDGSDSPYIIVQKWVSMDKLKATYPTKAADINKDMNHVIKSHSGNHVSYPSHSYDRKAINGGGYKNSSDGEFVNEKEKTYNLIRVYRKDFKRVPVLFSSVADVYENALYMYKKDITKFTSMEMFELTHVVQTDVDVVEIAGAVLLDQYKSDFEEYNITPIYANKIDNYFWGKVHEAKDAQRELNKKMSQLMEILNKMGSYGWGYTSEAFENPAHDIAEFRKVANKPGFMQKFKAGFQQHIQEFNGVKYPSEIVEGLKISSEKISTVMNVSPSMLGFSETSQESGVAIAQKQRSGLVGNEYLFDNLSLTKKVLGRNIVKMIQKYYSPERILRIVEHYDSRKGGIEIGSKALYPVSQPMELLQMAMQQGALGQDQATIKQIAEVYQQGGQIPEVEGILDHMQMMLDQQRRSDLLEDLNNEDLCRYDVVVSESKQSETTMMANYSMLSELYRVRPDLPLDTLLQFMPYMQEDVKNELIQKVAAQGKAAAEADQQKYQTEIFKSMPDHMKAMMMGVPNQEGATPADASA